MRRLSILAFLLLSMNVSHADNETETKVFKCSKGHFLWFVAKFKATDCAEDACKQAGGRVVESKTLDALNDQACKFDNKFTWTCKILVNCELSSV